jgi:serine/threonine-protein kinase
MVMEYLDGGDLAAWIQQKGPLPVEQAVEFILQASEAIAEAHGLGIIHRDLKPANLFCIRRADGLLSVKVLDFGISKAGLGISRPDMKMTGTQAVFGSPLYMSPEQMASSRDVDARTDIWSLGIILYELLTGVLPFNGEALHEVYSRIMTKAPQPLRDYRPDAPPGLQEVIIKCLEKNRNNRYLNVAELAVALSSFGPKRARSSVDRISRVIQLSGLSASAMQLPPSSESISAAAPGTVASWGRTAPSARRNRYLSIAAALGILVMLAGAGFLIFVRRPATLASGQPLGTVSVPVASIASVAPAASSALVTASASGASSGAPAPVPIVLAVQPSAVVEARTTHPVVARAGNLPSAKPSANTTPPAKTSASTKSAKGSTPLSSSSPRSSSTMQSSTPTKEWGGRL